MKGFGKGVTLLIFLGELPDDKSCSSCFYSDEMPTDSTLSISACFLSALSNAFYDSFPMPCLQIPSLLVKVVFISTYS